MHEEEGRGTGMTDKEGRCAQEPILELSTEGWSCIHDLVARSSQKVSGWDLEV